MTNIDSVCTSLRNAYNDVYNRIPIGDTDLIEQLLARIEIDIASYEKYVRTEQ